MNYLALGDSYTIGEQVRLIDSFPYQLVKMLRKGGKKIQAPEIIAKTAWTTTDLLEATEEFPLLESYDFATLLIGVNNQYRKLDIEIFRHEHEILLHKALKLVTKPSNLILVNIPDWGLTPFNKERPAEEVSAEIDDYNQIVSASAQRLGCPYIDVCTYSREFARDERYLVEDELHPSAKMYTLWAEKIFRIALNLS